MRDLWDEEKRGDKEQKESSVFSKSKRPFGKQAEEGLAKTREYYLEHLKRKKMAMDFFPEYQRYLADAGFSKIK